MLPHGAQLGDTILSHREPFRDNGAMDGCLSLWLRQEGHAKCTKVGPKQEVEEVGGVRPPCGMFNIVIAAK